MEMKKILVLLAFITITHPEASYEMRIISSKGCPADPPPAVGQQCHDPETGYIYTWDGEKKIRMGLGEWRVVKYQPDEGDPILFKE